MTIKSRKFVGPWPGLQHSYSHPLEIQRNTKIRYRRHAEKSNTCIRVFIKLNFLYHKSFLLYCILHKFSSRTLRKRCSGDCSVLTARQVLSAEMGFSADKGLSAETSAAVGFLAQKSEIKQIFEENARSELFVLVNACWMTCLNTNFILLLNCRIFG